ncbi:MAG: hypothetical protein ISR62_01295 [Desulfobacteraceae bacterium]|nr:hypothetical protein [Desulfobacteraceae bacterium]MBL7101387.1 hypothetical protein [Desulfobacteraceae bacterium]MBL7174165.1 hypothetical protein [Desulfobacteraceae bacterium]
MRALRKPILTILPFLVAFGILTQISDSPMQSFLTPPLKNVLGLKISKRLETVIQEANRLWETNIQFEFSQLPDIHGAFDANSTPPRILLNKETGLTEANIAHEIVHAILVKNGFPTTNKLFEGRRNDVVQELTSVIQHMPLVRFLHERGFDVLEYFEPTLNQIQENLPKYDEKKADNYKHPFYVHYLSITYLRLRYEAVFLEKDKKEYFTNLFYTYTPIGTRLGKSLEMIINNSNPYSPEGNALALYNCLRYLNTETLGGQVPKFRENLYDPWIVNLEKKYKF